MLGSSPARSGVEFLPFAFGVVLGSVLAVRPGGALVPRTVPAIGGPLTGVGFAWFSLFTADGSFAVDVLGPSLVSGVGIGLCLAPMASLGTSGVEEHEAGSASALLTGSRRIGAALGLAALGTVADARAGGTGTPEALADGCALGMPTGAAIAAAGVLIALAVLPATAPDTEDGRRARDHRHQVKTAHTHVE
ncbi:MULTISPECIES: hypothetical protein [Streptomyces]|uniref:MFS transporter n=2 Tax=Streptomyces TaxID=1883 RepID=A0ABU4K9W0_9ACTN|nr:hypothetical protein [Streptomyces roseolus]MDX2294549.1 hypothetical protein [Streptomyces roseolus]